MKLPATTVSSLFFVACAERLFCVSQEVLYIFQVFYFILNFTKVKKVFACVWTKWIQVSERSLMRLPAAIRRPKPCLSIWPRFWTVKKMPIVQCCRPWPRLLWICKRPASWLRLDGIQVGDHSFFFLSSYSWNLSFFKNLSSHFALNLWKSRKIHLVGLKDFEVFQGHSLFQGQLREL